MAVFAAANSAAEDRHAHEREKLKVQLAEVEQERLRDGDQVCTASTSTAFPCLSLRFAHVLISVVCTVEAQR